MGFKEDANFARFVAMGAVGAAVAADVLRERYGHEPIELERYAMANKVWQSKVKRLRLPDLVCSRCGLRVEARAKSKLAIVLSHSDTPGRGWDEGGMRDADLYAFMLVRSKRDEFPPLVADPVWFSTTALRASAEHAERSGRKSQSEGSEVTLKWKSWSPSYAGTFEGVDGDGRIILRRETGKRLPYWQWRDWPGKRHIYLESGEHFEPGEQLVAGTVEAPRSLECPGDTWDLAQALNDSDEVERLAAIRATGSDSKPELTDLLTGVALDHDEDWRVRLEALIALARTDPQQWVPVVADTVNDTIDQEQSMEAVLALSELSADEAVEALVEIAGHFEHHQDVRSAAAWGIGQGAAASPDRLLPLVVDDNPLVAVHAVSAVGALTPAMETVLSEWLGGTDQRNAAAAANLLARNRAVDVLLDAHERGEPARKWALYALGSMDASVVRCLAGARLTGELRAVLEPMWLREADWLHADDDDPLAALDLQKIRFDPLHPTSFPRSNFGADSSL